MAHSLVAVSGERVVMQLSCSRGLSMPLGSTHMTTLHVKNVRRGSPLFSKLRRERSFVERISKVLRRHLDGGD